MRRQIWGLAALMLAISLVFQVPAPAHGAGLGGGSYTYLLNGEEVAFPFDPVVVQEQLLLPAAVFERLGVTVTPSAGQVALRLPDRVEVRVTVGSPAYSLDGDPRQGSLAPIRLGGHLFLPAALLDHFGVEVTQAGSLLLLRQPLNGPLPTTAITDEEFQRLKNERSFKRELRNRQGGALNAEFTLLDPTLLQAPQLALPYGERVKLYAMLQTHTLVLVKLSNHGTSPAAFKPSSVVLVDDLRHQAELFKSIDVGDGDLSANLALGADRRGVMAFPQADPAAKRLLLYSHELGESLGAFGLNP